ncbi:hypothetical protein KKC32_03950 [Patescibacteria group bacterium]|nr:hypothetical protein [Patescibacteria group bacterium]
MKIHIAHSREFDFKKNLYEPISRSCLNKKHNSIFPNETETETFSSINLFQTKINLIIAEISFPSTGKGIELGMAHQLNIPIIGIYKKGTKPSGSVKNVNDKFIEYENSAELISEIAKTPEKII